MKINTYKFEEIIKYPLGELKEFLNQKLSKTLRNKIKKYLKKQEIRIQKRNEKILEFGSLENYIQFKINKGLEKVKNRELKIENRKLEMQKFQEDQTRRFDDDNLNFPTLKSREKFLLNLKCTFCKEQIILCIKGKNCFIYPRDINSDLRKEPKEILKQEKSFAGISFLNHQLLSKEAQELIIKAHIRHTHTSYEDDLQKIKDNAYKIYQKDNLNFDEFRELKNKMIIKNRFENVKKFNQVEEI